MKILNFKDHDGVNYIYNDDTGLIFELNEDNNIDNYDKQYIDNLTSNLKHLYSNKNVENSIDIENYYITNGFNQLTFKMTNECNLRCKYCIYSEHYENTDGYNSNKLSWEIAKKAIDIYMKNFERIFNINAYRKPTICFYGGEPLLNFDVIKKSVNYLKEKYGQFECSYSITTNGLLLNNEKICNFLKANNFGIAVSIDGTKENHDRNRVKLNNSPSYEEVLKNINIYFENYQYIYSICCIDYKTDIEKMNQFFEKVKTSGFPHLMRVSIINDLFTDYYNQFNDDEIKKFFSAIKKLRKEYVKNAMEDKKNTLFSEKLIGGDYFTLDCRNKFLSNNRLFSHNTSTCVPGDKIYVDTDGIFHICEKINSNFPIGDVNNGLNIKLIKKIIEDYNREILDKCKNCNISRICSACAASLASDSKFKFDKENQCKYSIEQKKNMLSDYVQILKYNPKFFENNYLEKNINKKKTVESINK